MVTKKISQETFDMIVKENIDEFDMTPEEALEEAIKQLESQGVDISLIVKTSKIKIDDGNCCDDSMPKHDIEICFDNLKKQLLASSSSPRSSTENKDGKKTAEEDGTKDDSRIKSLIDACKKFADKCSKSLPERCLVTKLGAYNILLASLIEKKNWEPRLFIELLRSFSSFIETQPDLLDCRGQEFFVSILEDRGVSEEEISIILLILNRCCFMHEDNRQKLAASGIIVIVSSLLEKHKASASIVKEGCKLLGSLTLDDDIRVPFGKSQDHAKIIVTEAGALELLLRLMKVHVKNELVLAEIFHTLSRLVIRDEFCLRVLQLGGVINILEVLSTQHKHQILVKSLFLVLKCLAGSDPVKVEILKHPEGAQILVSAAEGNIRNAAVCELACSSFAAVSLRNSDHVGKLIEAGVVGYISRAMQIHEKLAGVQKSGSMAIRNMVSRNPELQTSFLIEGGMELILRKALQTHSDCKDEINAALRDLGCAVNFKELWTGEGKCLDD